LDFYDSMDRADSLFLLVAPYWLIGNSATLASLAGTPVTRHP
jgi:hypothetical protein